MIRSQNGWSANDRSVVSPRTVRGTNVRLTVRNGPAGDLLLEVAALFDLTVQTIDAAADDWGYAERPIRGSATISNHASGTAIDLNATRWPLGSSPSVNLTPAQIATVRRIVGAATAGGRRIVRWGGDYTGRKDPMHFEIADGATEADCATALAALRVHFGRPDGKEDDDMDADQARMLVELHDWVGRLKPGVALPGRSDAARRAVPRGDDSFGAALNAWAEAATTREGIAHVSGQIADLAQHLNAVQAPAIDYDLLAASLLRGIAERTQG